MDITREELGNYIGQSQLDLPTPSVVLRKSVLERNCSRVLQHVKDLGLNFRAHVKTLKTIECTRLMLGGLHKKVIVSTLREIRGLLPLVEDGTVDEILYGLPCAPSAIPFLSKLAEKVKIQLMIDHESQIEALDAFRANSKYFKPWSVFIKLDEGSHRAGLELKSEILQNVIKRVESSPATTLHGFYCHAGRSYSCCSEEDTTLILNHELSTLFEAVELHRKLGGGGPLVLSFGATPTVHAIKSLTTDPIPKECKLELHGGNYPSNDLQQLSTNTITATDLAVKVVAEVCSIYPDRNEALINAGVLALSRETSRGFPGYGNVIGKNWIVGRLSQEHGILVTEDKTSRVEDTFRVGQKLLLDIQHVCIAVSGHGWYFIVDDDGIVIDIWYPWRGW